MRVRSLDQEDPLEKEMKSTPVIWPGKSNGQKNEACYSSCGRKRVGDDLVTKSTNELLTL